MKLRVIQVAVGGYRVQQVVTPEGLYIEWWELFGTEEAAQAAIQAYVLG